MSETILLVEDDVSIRKALQMNLQLEGYELLCAEDGEAGRRLSETEELDLIVVDLMLPRLSGLDLIRELRQRRADLPILVLSAKDQEADKVMALSLGADDYMTKPFGLAELLARVRALLRRGRLNKPLASSPGSKDGSRIYLDVPGRRLLVEGEDIETTAKEFDLLRLFMSHPGQVLTRDQIMQRLWGGEHFTLRTIDNFIVRLRSKIEENADTPVHLETVRGVGYRFNP
ncbi:MAG: response regulator transcription factor [Deltaproteobacteria bacterium]|jgi:DNA-binding response OmpR family regulator|nr:response regulator transcription factor [Deltaproteobacteria bacterium]